MSFSVAPGILLEGLGPGILGDKQDGVELLVMQGG